MRLAAIIPLLEPRDGLPPVVETDAALAEATDRLARGEGPVAVDAERASGYRYGQRAYLVQLRRAGSGTVLIDPIACPELAGVDAALAGAEAVLHAASQDLPCLAEIGYRPRRLFDTELAGRLLGYPRVALGTLVEEVLGFHLEKGHSAADWSTRPLREELLRVRRPRRGGADRPPRRPRGRAGRAGQVRMGPPGVRGRARGPPGPGPAGPVAPHVGHPPGAVPPRPGRGAGTVDTPGTGSPRSPTCPRGACCRTRPSSTRPGRTRPTTPS